MDDDENDLLNGDGNDADYANAYGQSYTANQTAFDQIDNGSVTQTGNTTTVTPPTWLQSLGSIFSTGTQAAQTIAPVVTAITGSTTAPATAVAKPAAGSGAAKSTTSNLSTTMMIVIGLVIAVAAWLFLRKK